MSKPAIPPATPRYAALDAWLDSIGAISLWTHEFTDVRGSITMYTLNGRVFLVQRFLHPVGFEIYTPAFNGLDLEATFRAVERDCRLEAAPNA